MLKPDDIYLVLLVLIALRAVSALIFAELFIHFRRACYAALWCGWLIYAAGPVLALRSYIVDGSINHPLFGYFAAVGTVLLLFGLILYYVHISIRWFLLFFGLFLLSLAVLISIYPHMSGYITVITQSLTLLVVIVFVMFKRKWFIAFSGIKSYLWLSLFLLYSLAHSFSFYYGLADLALSLRFFLTFVNNLILLVFLMHFDRERSFNMLVESEKKVQSSLREKEILLKELHHRVKNNLAVIISLIDLQASRIPFGKERDELLDTQNRIRTMSLVHEMLYTNKDLSWVSFREYLQNLTDRIIKTRNSTVYVTHEVEDIHLQPDILIPCGLIINELITNALKHAFTGINDPEIQLKVYKDSPSSVHLSIQDNGTGLSPLADEQTEQGLGLKLVYNLVHQIHGRIDVNTSCGTECVITFPVKEM